MSRLSDLRQLGHRLYTGEVSFDFVGRRKLWYTISALILAAVIAGLGINGLKYGIEFTGGSVYSATIPGTTEDEVRAAANDVTEHSNPIISVSDKDEVQIQISSDETKNPAQVTAELGKDLGVPASDFNVETIGPSWGEQISQQALLGLAIFMVLVTIYLAIAFEWRMALAALVALIHDLLITIGVYAIVGFEVTPGTVIGFLTILGYSLYDTVVVFDTVKENTRNLTKQSRRTYSEAANFGLNQTLVRSINTTVVALLPVAALLFIGGGLLGAGVLNDISLALFVGLAAGAYSSICVATPLLAQLKEQTPEMKDLTKRVAARRASEAREAAERAAGGGEPAAEDDQAGAYDEDGEDDQPVGAAGRRQPARNRGRGRPSGKRGR